MWRQTTTHEWSAFFLLVFLLLLFFWSLVFFPTRHGYSYVTVKREERKDIQRIYDASELEWTRAINELTHTYEKICLKVKRSIKWTSGEWWEKNGYLKFYHCFFFHSIPCITTANCRQWFFSFFFCFRCTEVALCPCRKLSCFFLWCERLYCCCCC